MVMHGEYHREEFVLRLRPQQLALANLPYDFHLFPASVWCKELLEEGVMRYAPNVYVLRQASPPWQPKTIRPDAGNLPWMVLNLKHERYELFEAWVEHVKMALPYLVALPLSQLFWLGGVVRSPMAREPSRKRARRHDEDRASETTP